MRIRNNTRFEYAKKAAQECLYNHRIDSFPIDLFKVINSYKNIKIISYSEMAMKSGVSFQEIIEANGSNDGALNYSRKRDKFFIAYNDKIHVKERIYWTLAHEFGHYILRHHYETDKVSLLRNELTIKEHEAFEREANFFARFLVSPPQLIFWSSLTKARQIVNFFGVSEKSATATIKYIESSVKRGFVFNFPANLNKQLSKYLYKIKYGVTCNHCNSFFALIKYNDETLCCPICSSTDTRSNYKGEDIEMYYKGVETDEENKAIRCPKCDNEEIYDYGDNCPICGVTLINKCSGDNQDPLSNECPIEILPSNFRYCPKCASRSTFFMADLLKSWEQEREECSDNEFEPRLSIVSGVSDDLPF